jgi:chromosome partitioning protein
VTVRSVAVANIKGGSGKTTVATHVASWLARDGRSVALADLDRQRSALGWVERRPSGLPEVVGVDLSRDWERITGFDAVVYDVPAAMRRKDLEEVVRAVDALVVPVAPSAFDEDGTRRFLDLVGEFKAIRKGRLPLLSVANRVRARTLGARRLEAFLVELELPPSATLRDAAAYAHLAAAGRSLFDETDSRSRALLEDWSGLLRALEEHL